MLLGAVGNVRRSTGSVYMSTTDDLVVMDATSGNLSVTLPSASYRWRVSVKKIDSSANTVTVYASGIDTVDGASSFVMNVQNQSADFHSDGGGSIYVL